LYVNNSDELRDVRDQIIVGYLPSGPTAWWTHAVWIANQSCEVRTKGKHSTAHRSADAKPDDLQALRKNQQPGII